MQKRNKKFKKEIKFGLILVVGLFLISFACAVVPFGVETIVVENTSTSTPDLPQSVQAQAGNVTELNIQGFSVTQTWQGYFGNVSGAIQLADSSDNIMYNWSLADPEGEIYASTDGSVDWANIECFNWTRDGLALESSFGIDVDDVDGVNETFSYGNGHDDFYTNNIAFTGDTCMSTQIFDSSGSSQSNNYEEVLLWDGDAVIFTSLLEESSVLGFDGKDHDFEMLVLEDGHETDTDVTEYYFYVELQ